MLRSAVVLMCLIAVVVIGGAAAQVPQMPRLPVQPVPPMSDGCTAPALFGKPLVWSAASMQAIAVLRGPGQIVTAPTASLALDVVKGFDGPVRFTGRVFTTDDNGNLSKLGKDFFASRTMALTPNGPGYFPNLLAGSTIPIGEVPVGNAGDETVVQVQLVAANGNFPIGPLLQIHLWARTMPSNKVSAVDVLSADILGDGMIRLTGVFPRTEGLIVESGDPEWSSGFASAVSIDGKTLEFQLPTGKCGNLLYPGGAPAVSMWGFSILRESGESFSFPNLIKVAGSLTTNKVTFVK